MDVDVPDAQAVERDSLPTTILLPDLRTALLVVFIRCGLNQVLCFATATSLTHYHERIIDM